MKWLQRASNLLFGGFECNSVYYAIYPWYKLCRFFGFYPVTLETRAGDVHFSIDKMAFLYSILVLILYTGGFYLAIRSLVVETTSNDIEYSVIAYFTAWAQIYSLFTLGLVALFSSWRNISSTVDIVKETHAIDNALEEIGMVVSYKKFKILFCLESVLLSVIPSCFSMVNCFILKVKVGMKPKLCFIFICFLPIMIILLKEIQFCNFMLLIKSKFSLINMKLKEFGTVTFTRVSLSNGVKKKVLKRSNTKEQLLNEDIWSTLVRLSEIYGRVNDNANQIMNVFSPHLLFMTAISLGVLTIQCYNFYAYLVNSHILTTYEIIATFIWIVIHSCVAYINCSVCAKTLEEMTKTSYLLHRTKWASQSDRFLHAVQMFSLEIMHRNRSFSAGGYFNLEKKLITSIFAAVTTYLVIIIQFHNGSMETIRNGTYKQNFWN